MRGTIAVFVALAATLLMVGISYSTWTKTLLVSGTVNTGYLDGEWTYVFNGDAPGITIPYTGVGEEIRM